MELSDKNLIIEYIFSELLERYNVNNTYKQNFINWLYSQWNRISIEKYAPLSILIMNTWGLGKFMFTSNLIFEEMLISEDYEKIYDIFAEYFPEIHSEELTQDEMNYLDERLKIELDLCERLVNSLFDTIKINNKTIKENMSMLHRYYCDGDCQKITGISFIIPDVIYLVDYDMNKNKCAGPIDIIVLIKEISKDEPINPITSLHFSDETLNNINEYFIYSKLWRSYMKYVKETFNE